MLCDTLNFGRNGHRPYEEGIKTHCCAGVNANPPGTDTDLMKKGLRLFDEIANAHHGRRTDTDLMKKGLRPLAGIYLVYWAGTDTDLMKKGLRPCCGG